MDEPTATTDAERELAARRRDLEREFDDKQRELKAQHKRQADKLQQDRLDWESHKRTQQKALADQAERIHRKTDNQTKAAEARAATAGDADALRERIQDLEQAGLKAKAARESVDQRLAKAEARYASQATLLWTFTATTVLGTGAWLVVALQSAPAMRPWAGVAFVAALGLNVWRLRVARR